MNGINAPKVLECVGSDGHKYRQLAKSGNDDLRQDAVQILWILLLFLFFKINGKFYIDEKIKKRCQV